MFLAISSRLETTASIRRALPLMPKDIGNGKLSLGLVTICQTTTIWMVSALMLDIAKQFCIKELSSSIRVRHSPILNSLGTIDSVDKSLRSERGGSRGNHYKPRVPTGIQTFGTTILRAMYNLVFIILKDHKWKQKLNYK